MEFEFAAGDFERIPIKEAPVADELLCSVESELAKS